MENDSLWASVFVFRSVPDNGQASPIALTSAGGMMMCLYLQCEYSFFQMK